MARLLRCATRLWAMTPRGVESVGVPVDCSHRVDIALPNGKQLLDVSRFGEGFAERGNKFVARLETSTRATG